MTQNKIICIFLLAACLVICCGSLFSAQAEPSSGFIFGSGVATSSDVITFSKTNSNNQEGQFQNLFAFYPRVAYYSPVWFPVKSVGLGFQFNLIHDVKWFDQAYKGTSSGLFSPFAKGDIMDGGLTMSQTIGDIELSYSFPEKIRALQFFVGKGKATNRISGRGYVVEGTDLSVNCQRAVNKRDSTLVETDCERFDFETSQTGTYSIYGFRITNKKSGKNMMLELSVANPIEFETEGRTYDYNSSTKLMIRLNFGSLFGD